MINKIHSESLRFLDAVRRYRFNPVLAARRYWTLYRHRHFSPDEIHFLRLLDPALTKTDLLHAVSKEELLAVQAQLNPPELHPRTDDKVVFHDFCRENGLPVPDILALYDPDLTNTDSTISLLRNANDIATFLCGTSTESFILKPVSGVNGEGVVRLDRNDTVWRDTHGTVYGPAHLMAIITHTPYSRWIFQRVVRGHPSIAALSDTSGLQTTRVVTIVDQNDDIQILAARLRLICGNSVHDNFDFGKTGNVIAILNSETGQIESAVCGSKDRYEIQPVTHHPLTGNKLIGFQVPNWEDVRKLAVEAAKKFRPLRSIGWDIAVTPGVRHFTPIFAPF